MTLNIDDLIERLASQPLDRSLEGLEWDVARGIARRSADLKTGAALAPVRVASIGLALAIGVTAGGLAAASTVSAPQQLSTFSVSAHLAPSTLIEGSR
ncbi:hypothetical protein [Caulobacter sp. DWP3-1-3b2]|uniref:hypothetical protein n=1 Tax=Caulobacter sp. DWP3-1-3b2 TaxID=2804643 RepID=UPI003CEDAF00